MNVRRKRIYLNEKRTRYCTVRLYRTKILMQAAYEKARPTDSGHYKCLGVHYAYYKLTLKEKKWKLHPETGTVFLSLDNCGAGIVCHELAHAVFWAYKNSRNKKQYPLVIKSMKDEEVILHRLTHAIAEFYSWYWKIKNNFRELNKTS